jgi:hypothetical protein
MAITINRAANRPSPATIRHVDTGKLDAIVPLDKSWIIRMAVLDIFNGRAEDTIKFLKSQKDLGSDLRSVLKAAEGWDTGKGIGTESATFFRMLQFGIWKFGLDKRLVKEGTLRDRPMAEDPNIINYPISELLKLDGGTSQWASAAVLFGAPRCEESRVKLDLTHDAVRHWNEMRDSGRCWLRLTDTTIKAQAKAFLELLTNGKSSWEPRHSEDYCLARALGMMTPEEGAIRWSSLKGHESDRIAEMETAISQFRSGSDITSKDHRVIQSIAMLAQVSHAKASFASAESVGKSWPLFWRFFDNVSNGARESYLFPEEPEVDVGWHVKPRLG